MANDNPENPTFGGEIAKLPEQTKNALLALKHTMEVLGAQTLQSESNKAIATYKEALRGTALDVKLALQNLQAQKDLTGLKKHIDTARRAIGDAGDAAVVLGEKIVEAGHDTVVATGKFAVDTTKKAVEIGKPIVAAAAPLAVSGIDLAKQGYNTLPVALRIPVLGYMIGGSMVLLSKIFKRIPLLKRTSGGMYWLGKKAMLAGLLGGMIKGGVDVYNNGMKAVIPGAKPDVQSPQRTPANSEETSPPAAVVPAPPAA